jgi:hypothetical protein
MAGGEGVRVVREIREARGVREDIVENSCD